VAAAAGRPAKTQGAPVNPPLILSSTFVSRGTPAPGEPAYARYDSPSHHAPEEVIGLLEAAPGPAVLFSSGMAAIAAVFATVPPGGRLVMPAHSYMGTLGLANELAAEGRIHLTTVAIEDTAAVVQALQPGAGPGGGPAAMLWIETPTNPLLEVADAPALIKAAHAVGALVAVDNTVGTPLIQQPLVWGADYSVHSASKYLGGHSDLVLGAVVAADAARDAKLREYRRVHGATPGSFDAFLLLRGLRTLALRVERANQTASDLARRLEAHPAVAAVHHPSLLSHPGHAVAAAQMKGGFGALLSIEVKGGAAPADAVAARTTLWAPATSLGGVESMLERRRRWPGEFTDVPPGLLRLSVGIEHVDDLWADLSAALDAAQAF
jgi:cystathionine gamma-synthase